MVKKTTEHKGNSGNKGSRGNKEFKSSPSMESRDQKPSQGKGFVNEVGDWQPGQGNNMPNSQNNQGFDLPELIPPKKSCLPKLLVLLLLILALGAFLIFGL